MESEVRLFGSFRVDAGGRSLGALEFGGRKPKQLLEILSLRAGRHVPKDRLARLLWGDKMPVNTSGSLEHYVSLLRRRLDPGVRPQQSLIVTEHCGYRLDVEATWVDLNAFDEVADLAAAGTADRDQIKQALGWVTGDLLEDEPYAEWALDARTHYRQRCVQLLVTAAELALSDRDIATARELAQQAVSRDPLVESGYQVLMLAAYARGDQSGALQTFQQVRRVLAEDLGIDPMPTTAALHQSMLSQVDAETLLPEPTRAVLTLPQQRVTAPDPHHVVDVVGARRTSSVHRLDRRSTDRPGAADPTDRHLRDQLQGDQPTGGTALVVESLRRRDPELLSVASVSAIVDQPCVPEGVARLTGLSPLHVAVLQERLCDLGVLRVDGEAFSFVDDDVRAALAGIVSPARRRLLDSACRRAERPDRRRGEGAVPATGDRRNGVADRRLAAAVLGADPWQGGWPVVQVAQRVG